MSDVGDSAGPGSTGQGQAPGGAEDARQADSAGHGGKPVSTSLAEIVRKALVAGVIPLVAVIAASLGLPDFIESKQDLWVGIAAIPLLPVLVVGYVRADDFLSGGRAGFWAACTTNWRTLLLVFALLCLSAVIVLVAPTQSPVLDDEETSTVVMMDSPKQDVVYSTERWESGGTNADDITEILDDPDVHPPVSTRKETTSLTWDRTGELIGQDPDLIIIHASAFYDETNLGDTDDRLASFLNYVAPQVGSNFLIYSRAGRSEDELRDHYAREFPELQDRLAVMWMRDRAWSDLSVRTELKTKVQSLLGNPVDAP